MKASKKNIHELLVRIKDSFSTALIKARAKKLILPRPSAFLIRLTTNKTKILKAKYSQSRLRLRSTKKYGIASLTYIHKLTENTIFPQIKSSFQFIRNISVPKFSLYQLPLPGEFRKYLNLKTAVTALVVVALSIALVKVNTSVDAFAVEVDGKQVAVVTNKAEAEKLFIDLKAEKARSWEREVEVQQNLVFKNVKTKKYQLDSPAELNNELNNNLTFIAVATGIKVNGQVTVVVNDEAAAAEVLQKLKDSFTISDLQVDSVNFQEEVELAQVPVALNEVLNTDQAVAFLKEGKQKKITHTVTAGDSLWTIARKNDMHVEDLLKINPAIKGEHLDLGQEINLVAMEPIINVMVSGQQTVKETLPYKVVVQTDKSIWRGRETVKTKGQNGLREVAYRIDYKNGSAVSKQVLQEKVLKAAKDQVIVKGSKYVVASRSGGGIISWPLSGKITSSYGSRWGSVHTGIDIDGYTGQPVGAAAAGVVTSAGRDGAYGKMVTVKHSNGLVTRYAHLSKIEVSSGQSVEKGDLIGLVGSTGRSTGSHLHFEVLSNGSFRNPISMLR